MSEFPYGWIFANLEELGLPTTPNVNPENHQDEIFELYSVPAYAEGTPEILAGSEIGSTKQEVQPGDILLCKIVPHLIRVWVVGDKGEYRQIASGEWIVVRPPFCDKHYIRHLLMEPAFREKFMLTVSGVGGSLLRARPKLVAQIDIPIAPLAEQHRIVAKLDALFARTRQALKELEHIPTLIEHYKQAILASAFRGELTAEWRTLDRKDMLHDEKLMLYVEKKREELWTQLSKGGLTRGRYQATLEIDWKPDIDLPDGWIWVSVDQLVALTQYGTSSKTTEEDIGVPVLRMGNIQDGRLDLSSLKYLPSNHDEFPALFLDDGDILFNRTNSAELVGKSAVVKQMSRDMSFASYLIRLKASGMYPELLVYYINSPFGRDWVASVVTQQVGQANVNGTKLRQLGVPLMPLEEQFEILACLDTAFAWLDTVLDEATSALRLLDRLDQATLAKAFRGELVPQDLGDEPAPVLLERIREARAAQSNGSDWKKRK